MSYRFGRQRSFTGSLSITTENEAMRELKSSYQPFPMSRKSSEKRWLVSITAPVNLFADLESESRDARLILLASTYAGQLHTIQKEFDLPSMTGVQLFLQVDNQRL